MIIKKIFSRIKSAFAIFELAFIKKRAHSYQYNLIKDTPVPYSEILIENFFKTNFKKSALISYIVYPFLGKIETHHSNNRECYTIAEILNELEYNVDLINWDNTTFLPGKSYDLVIDNHNNLERLSSYLKPEAIKIFHATNSHWLFQNWIEYGRYYDFFLKKGVAVTPPRLNTPGNSAEYADYISMFGNKFTKDTYGKYANKVHHLPMSATTEPSMPLEKDFAIAKKKILWLNSHGVLLKGLDIAINTIKLLPDVELFICGNIEWERKFLDALDEDIKNIPNIHLVGWIDTSGEEFSELTFNCAWVLNTSFSEGGGGSTLNCMAKGLVPVISRAASIDLPPETGFYVEDNSVKNLSELIIQISEMDDEELLKMSRNSYEFILANHTIENFKLKYKSFLSEVLISS